MNIISNNHRRTLVAVGAMLAAGGLSVAPGLSNAQAFSIIPMQQDFRPDGRDAEETLFVENTTDAPALLNLKVLTRAMDANGREINGDTNDFAVFPRQTVVGPRQTQVVRLQWQGPANPDRELAYRIIAEQHPMNSPAPKNPAVKLALRYIGAIYVKPAGAEPAVVVESARAVTTTDNRRALELVLSNRGRAHALINEPALSVTAGGTTRTLAEADLSAVASQNILGDSKRTFVIAWPAEVPFGQPTVNFRFTPEQ